MRDLQDRVTEELSGGERLRLAVARCLVVDASLILLDEPTAQVDQRNEQRVINLLVDAARRAIVICATQDAELIRQADTVHSLDTDRSLADLPAAQTRTERRDGNANRTGGVV
jgi:ABC-type transport system involved in cytochrome bd biosynthesis fused ATPase/permease subunit